MTTYRVYFKQVNQDYIDVEAPDVNKAIDQAKLIWRQCNPPEILGMPEVI